MPIYVDSAKNQFGRMCAVVVDRHQLESIKAGAPIARLPSPHGTRSSLTEGRHQGGAHIGPPAS